MTNSTHLKLPFILPGQAQKHVTHNEAVAALDTLTQLAVLQRDLGTPPSSPAVGARYIVGPVSMEAWAGKTDQIATWDGATWVFFVPEPGWLAYVVSESGLVVWSGTAWAPTVGLDGQVQMLGVNATPDGTNRLAVSAGAVLFSADVDDVRLKLNKHSSGGTASLLFQTGFSGRAELGTAGDDNLRLKLSVDGTSWTDALVAEGATGNIGVGTDIPAAKLDVDGAIRVKSYTVGALPPTPAAGQIIYVADENGGATLAFSDGSNWRRVADRAVVS